MNVLNTLYNSDILEIKVILMLTKLGFRTTDRLTNVNLIHPSLKYIVSARIVYIGLRNPDVEPGRQTTDIF